MPIANIIPSKSCRLAAAALLLFGAMDSAVAQERPDPATLMKAQREAMATFAFMDGVWRGPASTLRPDGSPHDIMQTERIGPLLDGTVKVIEGRGYEPDGRTSFNAMAIISYNVATQSFSMRSYALGLAGDYAIKRTTDGFSWEIPAGLVTIRYSAVVKDGTWTEVGDRIAAGRDPVRFFEMKLHRVGDSEWPGAGAIPPR
ncbi:MAG: DUF1579 domain-containing protein [Casimicrobiaceae bacterium]